MESAAAAASTGLCNAHSTVDYITVGNCHHFGISAFVYDCFYCLLLSLLKKFTAYTIGKARKLSGPSG